MIRTRLKMFVLFVWLALMSLINPVFVALTVKEISRKMNT